ncbi:MAG TPA: patatin-like phospholipase family protein [Pantanalinema sp.]
MGKTALVLSGGGLKGAYEAGVLRTLAEAGIVPDVIVGVSAGALNGAYVASMVAEGAFTPQRLDEFLVQLWATRATLEDFFYTAEGEFAPGSLGEASVQRIFHRIGIDPFKKISWIKVGLDALLAMRELAFGRFTSICSHGFIKEMLESYLLPPDRLVHPVTFSIAVSDLLGTTFLEKDQIATRHCHYETFRLAEPLDEAAAREQYAWMRSVIMASCSVPTVFPATKMHLTGQERPGLYLDGGMVENSPITQAIELDPEVDTVFVVMAATVVGEPSREPATFVQMIGRVFSIIAGRYLIQNFHDVRLVNERILAMRQVLDRDRDGEILRSARNDLLCRAAGFNDVTSFLKKRYVRLVPIGPTTPLPGGMFSALYYPELKRVYLDRGVEDGRAALAAFSSPSPVALPRSPGAGLYGSTW